MDQLGEWYLSFPFLGVFIDAEASLLFSGDLNGSLTYSHDQAISCLTIELSFSIKSSPLYPFLEIKL
jgi:hypothetical protein